MRPKQVRAVVIASGIALTIVLLVVASAIGTGGGLASLFSDRPFEPNNAQPAPSTTERTTPSSPTPTVRPALPPPAATTPVITPNHPDPDVIKVGEMYYAYATNTGRAALPVAVASRIYGPWRRLAGDALPELPRWAAKGYTWAPDLFAREDETFVLYYSARRRGTEQQCIGVATSISPAGPFEPIGDEPLVCPLENGGAIDPAAFVDADGTRYLLFKSGVAGEAGSSALYLQRMSPDGVRRVGAPRRILSRGSEPDLIESPALVRQDGRYVLFYSAGHFFENSYQTRYAVATSIAGPYRKAARPLLSTTSFGGVVSGPGGAEIVRDGGRAYLAFHGILDRLGEDSVLRGMYVADLGWANGRPVVRGSWTRYEADDGTLNNCTTRRAEQASSGQVVAHIDRPDSWVEVQVFAPVAADYTVRIRYANRSSGRDAAHSLTINGTSPRSVTYPPDPDGRWHTTSLQVRLRDGWNTLRFRHATRFAELDHIDVA